MAKEMLINVSEGEECRIALLEDGKLEELYMERSSSTSHVGNIYKGKVTNVEASIQAAFVDFGLGRNGFLHISDLLPQYFGRKGEDVTESVGRKMARRDRPPIQRCLRRGDEVIVQIIKEGIGTKGPTLSTYLSIPGRILVMMPGMASKGVSRKIEDEEERRRLRKILDELKPPKDCGFIIRTAGVGKSKADIERDLKFLTRLNDTIQRKIESSPAPVELYTEGDLVTRSVRDIFTADIETIVVDNADVADKITDFVKMSAPRTKNKVELYEGPVPLFHKYGIEREIEQMYSRHVPLPGGGSLVIDSTEAVVAIDVNSGKFRDHSDAETTAFKTDMEAADEIARQLKLRDLGGVIICDFIDLRYERHRRQLEERLHENLQKDKAKTKVLRMSQFGIIEMTRQRMRPSLKRSVYFDCPHCKGSGLIKTHESMSLDVMRRLAIAAHDQRVARVEIAMCADVAFYMLNNNRAALTALEQQTGKAIDIKADPALALDEHKMVLFDSRDGLVYMPDLGIAPEAVGGRQQQGRGAAPAARREERRPARVIQPQRRNDADDDHEEEDDRGESGRPEASADHREEDHDEASTGPLDRTPDGDGGDFRSDEVGGRSDRRDSRGGPQQQGRGDGRGRQQQQQQPRRDDRGGRDNNNRNQPQARDDRNRPRDERGGRDQQRDGRPQPAQNRDRQQQPPIDRSRLDRDRVQPPAGQRPPAGARPPVNNDVPDTIELDAQGQPSSADAGGDQHDQFDAQSEDGGGRKRRRRRRGGRGRGGRGNGAPGGQPATAGSDAAGEFDAPADDETAHDDAREESREESAMDSVEDREEARDRDRDYDRDRRGGDDDDNGIAPAPEPMEDTSSARPEPAEVIADEPQAAPAVEEEPATVEEPQKPEKAEKPKRRRAGAAAPAPKAAPKAKGAKAAKGGRKPRGSAAAAAAAEAASDAPVRIPPPSVAAKTARTGSTDRHQLQTDTPVDPEPVRRPKSYRDLDDIPDDFD